MSPSGVPIYTWVNTRNSATPKTISGVTMGTSISPLAPLDNLPRQRCRPMAIATPIGVAMSMHSTASFRVFPSAMCSASSCHTDCHRVAPVPAQRRRLERGPALAGVERDAHGDEHRQQRPQHVEPGDHRQHRAHAPVAVDGTGSSLCRPLLSAHRDDEVVRHQHEQHRHRISTSDAPVCGWLVPRR